MHAMKFITRLLDAHLIPSRFSPVGAHDDGRRRFMISLICLGCAALAPSMHGQTFRASFLRGYGSLQPCMVRQEREFHLLCPDDVLADKMSAEAVVDYVMEAFRPAYDEDDGWQFSATQVEVAGSAFKGCRVLLSFSQKKKDRIDDLGQLQPGAFALPSMLENYLLEQDDYRTLALVSEWKPLAPPTVTELTDSEGLRRAAQKLLVRRERGNWEEANMNLELCETPRGQRWLVTSLYKWDHEHGVSRSDAGFDGDDGDPEEARNC